MADIANPCAASAARNQTRRYVSIMRRTLAITLHDLQGFTAMTTFFGDAPHSKPPMVDCDYP